MTYREIRTQLKRSRKRDTWWLAVDGKVMNKPVSLTNLMMKRKHYTGHQLQLLHVEDKSEGSSSWIDFQFTADLRLYEGLREGPVYPKNGFTERRASPPCAAASDGASPYTVAPVDTELNRIVSQLAMDNRSMDQLKSKLQEKEMELTEREKVLLEKQKQLDLREEEVKKREQFIEMSEEALIEKTFKHEERQAEIEQMADECEGNQ